jgi:hypothetical protein
MSAPQDSTGRPIAVGDIVSWRGQVYTIHSFGDPTGRCNTRTIAFEEPLHIDGEIPDEIGIDLVEKATDRRARLDRAFARLEVDPEHAKRIAESFWEARRKIGDASPCLADRHCMASCPMAYVAVKKSVTTSHRGCPREITSLAIDPAWNAQIAEFCETLGIKTKGMKVGWWLVSDWSE